MKALSIKEPWLSMIIAGTKTIETRTWYTDHRGDLLLVGCKCPVGQFSGVMACVVNLVDCRAMTVSDAILAQCDFYDGYSWVLEDVRCVSPRPIRGQQRLYWVNDWAITYEDRPQLELDLI